MGQTRREGDGEQELRISGGLDGAGAQMEKNWAQVSQQSSNAPS